MRQRDPAEPLVRGYAVTHPRGTAVLPQSADWDQLVYAARGVMTVVTASGTWVVPPDRAVWVPAGIEHRIVMAGRTAIRTLFLAKGRVRCDVPRRNGDIPRQVLLALIRPEVAAGF